VRATVDLECSACHSAVAVPDGTEWTRRCKECSGIPETLGIPLDLMTAVT
jgi:hypothetical protein